jgi:hypothetical protein
VTRHVPPPGVMAAFVALALLSTACTDETGIGRVAGDESSAQSAPAQLEQSPGGWMPIPGNADGFLPAGRLGMTANGRPDAPWAVVEVPEMFSSIGGWVIFDEDPEGGGGVGYWTVSEVVRAPCSEFGAANAIDAGSTVEQLAAAFKRQRLTRMTTPVPVTVDNYDGLSLELRVPKDIDFARCPEYNVWESDPAGARHMGAPGEFDTLWILDVEGDVVVLTVTADPDVPKSALDRLTGMIESVEFIPRS